MAHETSDGVQQQEQVLGQEDTASSSDEGSDSPHAIVGSPGSSPERPQARQWWKFKLRPPDDEDDQ